MSWILEFDRSIGCVINLIEYALLIGINYYAWLNPRFVNNTKIRWSCFLLLIICLTPFYCGDFFHYFEWYEKTLKFPLGEEGVNNMELVYNYLIHNTYKSYILFRLVIWGVSIYMLLRIPGVLGINKNLFLYVYMSSAIVVFCYGRVSLAITMMFLGLAVLLHGNKLLGLLLIIISFYFHKSALFGILMICIAILLGKISKARLTFGLLSIPLIIILIKISIAHFLIVDADSNTTLNVSMGQRYLSEDSTFNGFGINISYWLNYFLSFMWILMFIKCTIKGYYFNWPKHIRIFANTSFLITIVSTLMLLASTRILQVRFIEFAFIPSAIMLCYCKIKGILPQFTQYVYNAGLAFGAYTIIYITYCEFVKS